MGYYIEVPENTNKAEQVINLLGATEIPQPTRFDPPEGMTLLCAVVNGLFDAVGIIYDEDELVAFSDPRDWRPRTWLLLDTAIVLRECPQAAHVLDNEEAVRHA